MTATTRYIAATGRIEPAFNRIAKSLPRFGIGLFGARLLAVRGRRTGQWRTTIINVLTEPDGTRYLVAPRGHTQWVRNLRAADGIAELRLGRRTEPITTTEIADDDKIAVLRNYLQRWGWEVGRFFDGITDKATDAELTAIAPGFPVFRIN